MKISSGVYRIINNANNKVYIGSSINLNQRKSQHFYALRNNIHRNINLQNDYNKFEINDFVFEILEFTIDLKELINREQYWINNSIFEIYNISNIAGIAIENLEKGRVKGSTRVRTKITHNNNEYSSENNKVTLYFAKDWKHYASINKIKKEGGNVSKAFIDAYEESLKDYATKEWVSENFIKKE